MTTKPVTGWLVLPAFLVADILLLWLVVAVNDTDPAVAKNGECTVSVVPAYWVYLVFWLFALAAAGTAVVAVLTARWIFARRGVSVRIAAVVLAAAVAGPSMVAAVVVPVNLHEDSVPRTFACEGGF
jgi:hypothetical protein